MEYSNTKYKNIATKAQPQQQQLNNDVLHRIFQLSGIKCHVCYRKLNTTTVHTFLKERTVAKYYCSVDCYNHI